MPSFLWFMLAQTCTTQRNPSPGDWMTGSWKILWRHDTRMCQVRQKPSKTTGSSILTLLLAFSGTPEKRGKVPWLICKWPFTGPASVQLLAILEAAKWQCAHHFSYLSGGWVSTDNPMHWTTLWLQIRNSALKFKKSMHWLAIFHSTR